MCQIIFFINLALVHFSPSLTPTYVRCSAGENRLRYFELLMNGSYTPRTLPVGGEEAREVSPRSLAEALLVKTNLTICKVNNFCNAVSWSYLMILYPTASTCVYKACSETSWMPGLLICIVYFVEIMQADILICNYVCYHCSRW